MSFECQGDVSGKDERVRTHRSTSVQSVTMLYSCVFNSNGATSTCDRVSLKVTEGCFLSDTESSLGGEW
jgi:hypothetical protein